MPQPSDTVPAISIPTPTRDHWVAQQYLPAGLEGRVFFEPGALGYEAAIRDQVLRRREELLAAAPEQAEVTAEGITYSPEDPDREDWLRRAGSAASRHLGTVRDALCTPRRHAAPRPGAGRARRQWPAPSRSLPRRAGGRGYGGRLHPPRQPPTSIAATVRCPTWSGPC